MRKPLSVFLLSTCVLSTGCYSTYIVPRSELTHLDGYDIHSLKVVSTAGTGLAAGASSVSVLSDHRVLATDGTAIEFNSNEELKLVRSPSAAPDGSETVTGSVDGGKFREIHVTDADFSGELMNGSPFKAAMADVNHAELTVSDPAKTNTLLVAGSSALLVGSIVVFFLTRPEIPEPRSSL